MNMIKNLWKKKIRVLLPESVKRILVKIHRFFVPENIFSTTNRDEFLAKIAETTHNQSSPAQVWWKKQKNWKASDATPDRYQKLVSYLQSNFCPYLQNDYTVCDLACACGDFSFVIADKIRKIEAFDLSEDMINEAIRQSNKMNIHNIVFRQADALTLDLPPDKYDAFMMLGLLTCLDDSYIDGVMQKIYLSMKMGAALIIKDSITNEKSTQYIFNYENSYSAYYRTEQEYIAKYEKCGFKKVNSIYLDDTHNSFVCIFIKV